MELCNRVVCALVILVIAMMGCKKSTQDADKPGRKYSIYVRAKDGQEYLIRTSQLSEGTILPVTQGMKVNTAELNREMIVKDGAYFYLNDQTHQFCKSNWKEIELHRNGAVNMPNFSIENYAWIGVDSLFVIGLDSMFTYPSYFLLRTDTLRLISSGRVYLPVPVHPYNSFSIGFVNYANSEFSIGYNYHELSERDYATGDTMYVATLRFPEMTRPIIATDVRSAYPGGYNIIQSNTYIDEQGDFYFITSPGILLGRRPDKPTTVMRIKKGEHQPDTSFLFNVSGSSINNHGYGLWYLGNGKAIVRTEKNGSFTGWNDYHNVEQFSFYVLDLATNSANRLDLPLDKGGRKECVLVEDGIAYIAINSTSQGNAIWQYDIRKGSLKKGMTLEQEVDYIFRIDRLK